MTIDPDFSATALVLAAPLVGYLTIGEPLLGRRMYASLQRRRDSDANALVRYFGISLVFWAALGALAVLMVAISPGVRFADVGLTAPERPIWNVLGALGIAFLVLWFARDFRRKALEGRNIPGQDAIRAMLPRTPAERRIAAATALVSGVGAELVYRGLLIALAVDVLDVHLYVAAGLAVVIASLAGLYQGPRGIPVFLAFGATSTVLYLVTESLLLPIVWHCLLVFRDLVLVPPSDYPEPRLVGNEG